jgi:putative hydrolase of the HAD superfamily
MRYGIMRDSRIHLFHDSIEALEELSARTRLALVTNGESGAQRAKISRFNIERFFEKIFVEEEVGVGKPDVRAFENVLREMKIRPSDTWMVGDNLQWDVAAPMKLGIKGIWFDYRGKGLPDNPPVVPDRVIRSLTELL